MRKYLTHATIEKLRHPKTGRIEYKDTEQRGLYLRVSATGTKSFICYGRCRGKAFRKIVGYFDRADPECLSKARIACQQIREDARNGRTPDAPVVRTFGDLAREYIRHECTRDRLARPGERARVIERELLPYWSEKLLTTLERHHLTAITDPIKDDRPQAANRVHNITNRVFNWALTDMTSGVTGDMTMGGMERDLNDIEFDAYLANDRTLADPEVVGVELGGRVRLRIINAAASTNFFLDLGGLEGELIAVDGLPVAPVRGRRFPIAIAQRLDIRLTLPAGQGAHPVFAHREGDTARTGVLLATPEARIERLADHAEHKAPAVGLDLERRLAAVHPLGPRPAGRTHVIDLTGSMKGYNWGLNGVTYGDHKPFELRQGERIEIAFRNKTMMAHPMHMHGLPFQVVEIDGERFAGAMRDTVLVPANGGRVTVAFDAVNPGTWVMHCHNLYHMAAGMMTTLTYVG